MPDRFPPSVLWIVGPSAFLAAYLWAARRLAPLVPAPWFTLAAGRHVLASLILSNLAIFGIRRAFGHPVEGALAILGATLALFAAVTLFGAARTRLAERGRAAP